MRIGILGAGGMADALGTRWAAGAGHEVMVGGRDADKAAALAERIGGGARAGSFEEAAEFGDAVLLALPYTAAREQAGVLRETLRGRVLIDCTNDLGPGFTLAGGGGPSAAEGIAAAASAGGAEARVVKAFNLCHEGVWRLTPPEFGGRALAVPLCGDDESALAVVRGLVKDLGCEPVSGGGLGRAGLLEATAALLIGLWVGEGVDAQAIAPPLEFAAG
ncbi:NADPH-dependent F420 reductase [Streptomyces sp. NPDC052236]|uniref:NADPH-dependent F420 reductase n=1 Tax=Streptomyces sp. NPDC052236 TaxID=3365686 RepID=UPI0037D73067